MATTSGRRMKSRGIATSFALTRMSAAIVSQDAADDSAIADSPGQSRLIGAGELTCRWRTGVAPRRAAPG